MPPPEQNEHEHEQNDNEPHPEQSGSEGEDDDLEQAGHSSDEEAEQGPAGSGPIPFDSLSRQQIRSLIPYFISQAGGGTPGEDTFEFVQEEDLSPAESEEAYDLTGLTSLIDDSPRGKAEHSASTTDHEEQGVRNTLSSDDTFWSSSGSASPNSEEWLSFRLREPLNAVFAIQIAVYRAGYQLGEPIYPPHAVQVAVSPTPLPRPPWDGSDGRPPAPLLFSAAIPVKATDAVQTLLLGRSAAVGQYVTLRLVGKRQRQLEDNLYYIALRHVGVLGRPIAEQQLHRVHRALAWAPHGCRHPPNGQLNWTLVQRAVGAFPSALPQTPPGGDTPPPAEAAG